MRKWLMYFAVGALVLISHPIPAGPIEQAEAQDSWPIEAPPEVYTEADYQRELDSLKGFRLQMEARNKPKPVAATVPTINAKVMMAQMKVPAKVSPSWRRTLHQGYELAKVMINENTRPLRSPDAFKPGTDGELTEDHHGMAAVVVNNKRRLRGHRQKLGRRVANWHEVMGELAPHVMGVVPSKKRPDGKWKQHYWTKNLPEEGCDEPEGFPEGGDWRLYAENWCKFRDEVRRRWVNNSFDAVPGRPIGWGNEQDLERAVKRGYCVIEGLGDRNGFIARPGNGCIAGTH